MNLQEQISYASHGALCPSGRDSAVHAPTTEPGRKLEENREGVEEQIRAEIPLQLFARPDAVSPSRPAARHSSRAPAWSWTVDRPTLSDAAAGIRKMLEASIAVKQACSRRRPTRSQRLRGRSRTPCGPAGRLRICSRADADLLVKLAPWEHEPNPCRNGLDDSRSRTCVAREPAFTKALEEADLVVLDNPSTPLLKALPTHLPTWLHFLPSRTRVARAENPADDRPGRVPGRARTGACGRGLVGHRRPWRRVLSRFGTHLNDGRSAERELAELLKLARR